MIVVKVGGSLYDHPALGPCLRRFVESLAPADVLLVPGGGPVADAVRKLDRTHEMGEEAAHWLALHSLGVTGAFLERILEEPTPSPSLQGGEKDHRSGVASEVSGDALRAFTPFPSGKGVGGLGSSCRILDCFAFAQEDETRPDALPHTWAVTTDSIAARAAVVHGAERLILLKSTDILPDIPWETAAANGWVDTHFPLIALTLTCPVEIINFRKRLDAPA